nr:putative ribonuclease H-like domain-containing protein [Tanacetum cinerariifolium]
VADEEAPTEFVVMANISAESKVFDNSLCSKDSSKDLDNLLESQRLDKNKEGLGYSVVPPPPTQIYSSPKKDMSWTGLLEFKDDTVTNYSRPAPTVESYPDDTQNRTLLPTKSKREKAEKAKKSFVNGCSRHMTCNISYLSDFEPFEGGYVSFVQGGYKITGKGTIKTSTNDEASQELKKDVFSLRYIALPNWVHDALLESSSSKPQDDCSYDVPESSGNTNSTATSTNPLVDQLETLTVETLIPTIKPLSDTRIISKRVANQVETPSLDNILTLTNRFEDILGVTTNLVDSDGEDADVSNMETTITASPTSTLRIHKDHPKRVKPIGIKWVLKNKKDERGIAIRNKARLVAQGHTQEEGIDYDEVFSPIARIKVIILFLAYASFMGFTVYQMDVKSVFLYGTIDKEVYVIQPPRFQDPDFPAKVYKVEKAMYELHQAPRAWYGTLSTYLLTKDSDYGGATQHHKSTTGGCQFLGRRDCFEKKLISVDHIDTDENVADLLTKPFDAGRLSMPCKDLSREISSSKLHLRISFNTYLTFTISSKQDMDQQYPIIAKIPMLDTAPESSPSTTTISTTSGDKSGRTVTLTTEDMQKKKNDTFGGNEATKKTKKNLLKQQYGNFRAEGSEMLEQTFTRLQVIVGQLQFMGVEVEQDDLNQKGNDEVNTASVYTTSSNVPTASTNVATDINQINEDDMEEIDIKWNMALLSMRADKVGWDWSYMANDDEDHVLITEAPTEFALMADISTENKVFDNSLCSKDCKKNNDSLNSKITDLTDKLFDAKNMIYHYKLALAQVESKLVEYKEREVKYIEKIRTLEFYDNGKVEYIETLKKELETLKQEKEVVDGKLAGLLSASKDLDNLIESQSPSFSGRIVPLFDTMLIPHGEGLGTPTEPHHTPSLEAHPTSHTTLSSLTHPPVTTALIPTVTPSETTPLRQYTKRDRIAQSSALPPVADEFVSPLRDVSEVPRVTSPAADEGKDREGVAVERSEDDAPIKGRNFNEGEAVAERVSDDTKEMATILTSMDGATVLVGGAAEVPTGSGSIPTTGSPATEVPTGSDVVPTTSVIFTTATVVTLYRRRKGKEIMVESENPKKKKKQLEDFIPMGSKEEAEMLKTKDLSLEQESVKKLKTSEEVPEEAKSPDEVPKEKNLMHATVEWKLYDMCGVHQVTSKDKEIFMLVEKDYPLRKGLAIGMIYYKLQGRIVGNKMHKAFPLSVMEFPLPGEVPTASEESSHYQKKKEATAVKIARLLKSRRNCQSKSDDSYTKLVPYVMPCNLGITGRIVGNKIHKAFSLLVMEFPLPREVLTACEESSHCQKKREANAVKIALLLKSRRNCQSKSDDSYT